MAAVHEPAVAYRDYAAMLADPRVEAVVVATSDPSTSPEPGGGRRRQARPRRETPRHLRRGVRGAARPVREAGVTFQVGNNWRFDPGFRFAGDFIAAEMGERIAIKVWYYDSADRYTMTDNLLPVIVASEGSKRPEADPKSGPPALPVDDARRPCLRCGQLRRGADRRGQRPPPSARRFPLLVRRRRVRRRLPRPPRPLHTAAGGTSSSASAPSASTAACWRGAG